MKMLPEDLSQILKGMSLDEKIRFLSGAGFWHMQGFEQNGIPQLSLYDGPHGVRKQSEKGDQLGLNESMPATCFPAESTVANSWDRQLLYKLGESLGMEARALGVQVLLGPGVNIKRNPLCGRNFEYYSEDPYLAGELGMSLVRGLQSQGVGASLKHFAANNQEIARMTADSLVDERALREIYLAPFEKVVIGAQPATVMAAYNRLNGTYCSENRTLLTSILREEWGFEGAVVSDWGAANDRVLGIKAGLDLDMPGNGFYYSTLLDAVQSGLLTEVEIDTCVECLLGLVARVAPDSPIPPALEESNQLAREIAANSAVLLKNSGILPLATSQKIAVVGQMAKIPRYQGTGSSQVNPTKLYSALDGLDESKVNYRYFEGYNEQGENPSLLMEAVMGVKDCDTVLVFAGLPEIAEVEGFDRENMQLPAEQNALIDALCKVHDRVVVVLSGGSPVEMPWIEQVAAVLHMYLPGQACGLAVADLIFGKVNPSGKLAESYPRRYQDVISAGYYGKDGQFSAYRESLYVGYRYYDTAGVDVLFPFGYGLSYTHFEYSDLQVDRQGVYDFTVSVAVKNTGTRAGAEVAQLYVSGEGKGVFSPQKELKGFEKIELGRGEEKVVSFFLDKRSFAHYDVSCHDWMVSGGNYAVLVGASSRDIRLQAVVNLPGEEEGAGDKENVPSWYWNPSGEPSLQDFQDLYGHPIPASPVYQKGSYTPECCLDDIKDTWVGKGFIWYVERLHAKTFGAIDYSNPKFKMVMASTLSMPLMKLAMMSSGQLSPHIVNALVDLANGRVLRGFLGLVGWRKPSPAAKITVRPE